MKYRNYRNSYNGDNRIYTVRELKNMTLPEIFKIKEELLAQNRAIGVPLESELRGSPNAVYVHEYTREDGTHVKAHWRSKVGGGENNPVSNTSQEQSEENSHTSAQTDSNSTKTNENLNKKLYPDEIAGVKRGKPMTKEQAGKNNVNPNYNSGDIGYKLNCAYCVPVHKAREMGYDIEALPARENDVGVAKMLRRFPYYAYESENGDKMEAPTKLRSENMEDCIKQIKSNIKEGECYEFWCHKNGVEDELAHTVEITKNDDGELEIYDPQNGNVYNKEYFEKIDYTKNTDGIKQYYPQFIFRIDNKKLKQNVLDKIARPTQRKSP